MYRSHFLGIAFAAAAVLLCSPTHATSSTDGADVSELQVQHVNVVQAALAMSSPVVLFEIGYADRDVALPVLPQTINKAAAPALSAKAVKVTTQAGWRSGRLRKLSA